MLVNGEPQKRADEILAEVAITLTLSRLNGSAVEPGACGVCGDGEGRWKGLCVLVVLLGCTVLRLSVRAREGDCSCEHCAPCRRRPCHRRRRGAPRPRDARVCGDVRRGGVPRRLQPRPVPRVAPLGQGARVGERAGGLLRGPRGAAAGCHPAVCGAWAGTRGGWGGRSAALPPSPCVPLHASSPPPPLSPPPRTPAGVCRGRRRVRPGAL